MRRSFAIVFCLIMLGVLSGCASTHGVVDNCPDVKNQSPSTLQGRGAGVGAEF